MKNKFNTTHVICLVACILGLISINYSNMILLDYLVVVVDAVAIIAILINLRRQV